MRISVKIALVVFSAYILSALVYVTYPIYADFRDAHRLPDLFIGILLAIGFTISMGVLLDYQLKGQK